MLIARLLLAASSLLLASSAVIHGMTIHRALTILDASRLPPFYRDSFKVLWIADATTMFIVAAIFGSIAIRPELASRSIVALLALAYGVVAALLYTFLGRFQAAHILLIASAMALIAAVQFRGK